MPLQCIAPDSDNYTMDYHDPHKAVEPLDKEIEIVNVALNSLKDAGILTATDYDHQRFDAHRTAVAERFEIPWTAITPRMQRLIYAINAIRQPRVMLAAGVFCGNTFISNAGAAVGPGACYTAKECLGIEIKPDEAARAERNVRTIDPTGVAKVVAADAVDIARDYPEPIDLLYLDADGDETTGKGIYLDILQSCMDRLKPGALIVQVQSRGLQLQLREGKL